MNPLLPVAIAAAHKAAPVGQHAVQPPGMFGALLTLLLVLGLIVGLGWLLKRLPGSRFRQAEGLKVVASLTLGAKERVAVVEVNGQQLLLGITAGGISTLYQLPEPFAAGGPRRPLPQLPNFAQMLSQKQRKDS